MTIEDQQLRAIAYLVNAARPSWGTPGVMAALEKVRDRELVSVAIAALRATQRQDQHTPAVIAADGKHWTDAPQDAPTLTPPTHRRGEFTPDNPIPYAEAIERIKKLRAIVRDNPPPPGKD